MILDPPDDADTIKFYYTKLASPVKGTEKSNGPNAVASPWPCLGGARPDRIEPEAFPTVEFVAGGVGRSEWRGRCTKVSE
jgi:hypothetical protein